MAYTHSRFGSTLALLLLGSTALGGTAQAGWLFGDSKKEANTESVKAGTVVQPAETLDGSIRQAQLLRVDGNYSEAIRHLSQLMMVASDDHRVINEYGKTLAAIGRAAEAVNFLTRAQQLQPGDWTVYSALGVAYDQMGKQQEAKHAYEQALALKPGEPSVLNNYALSRLLANDPDEAQRLIARAEIAGGASDPKIARNIAMIRDVAPASAKTDYAVTTPAPSPAPRATVAAAPLPAAPRSAVSVRNPQPQRTAKAAPSTPAPFVDLPTPPAPAPANTVIEARPQLARTMTPAPQGVVMQLVPVDPLAGPVAVPIPKPPVATRAPRTLAPKPDVARAQATPAPVKAAAAPAPAPAKKAEAPRKTAATAAHDLQAKAEAIAKQMEAEKTQGAKASKTAAVAKPAPKPAAPVKAAAKPAPTKPMATAAKSAKDSVPALRLSANAF